MAQETLASLTTRVRAKLSEASTRFFTGANITGWINEAQDVIAADCPWVVQSTRQRLTVPNCDVYLLDQDVIEVRSTKLRTSSGQVYRVDYVEPAIMDQLKQFARQASSASMSYRCTYKAQEEGTAVELFQPPSQRVRMVCEVFIRPKTLVNDSDLCQMPPYLTHVIVDYCLSQAKFKDEETQQSLDAANRFSAGLKDLRARRLGVQADQMNKTRLRRRIGGYWP